MKRKICTVLIIVFCMQGASLVFAGNRESDRGKAYILVEQTRNLFLNLEFDRKKVVSLNLENVFAGQQMRAHRKKLLKFMDNPERNVFDFSFTQSLSGILAEYSINNTQCKKDGKAKLGEWVNALLGIFRVTVKLGTHRGKKEKRLDDKHRLFAEYLFVTERLSAEGKTSVNIKCAILNMLDERLEISKTHEKKLLETFLSSSQAGGKNRASQIAIINLAFLAREWSLDKTFYKINGYTYEAKVLEKMSSLLSN